MDAFDFWRLAEELTIDQAAHLIIGILPGEIEAMASHGAEMRKESKRRYRTNLEAARAAICSAIRSGRLAATGDQQLLSDPALIELGLELDHLILKSADVKTWLAEKGVRSGFFCSGAPGSDTPPYLDPTHPRYSPKLAAAVAAWEAVEDPNGKHPKQALKKWLCENAEHFDLVDADGKLNDTGIEEIAKVANWQPGGGAPKTPS